MSATQTEWTPAGDADAGLRLVLPPRRVSAGNGWDWIARGWRLFARAPLMWILSLLILIVVAVVMNFIPILGSLVFQVLNAAIAAGFVVACRSLERGGEFELEHLFAGFRRHFGSLVIVGLLFLAGEMVIFAVFLGFVGFPMLGAFLSGDTQQVAASLMHSLFAIALGGLVALALMVPLIAAFWFAPALVVMHGMAPLQAMKASLVGSLRNFWAFLVYGIVMTLFAILIPLTLGLGLLIWLPVTISSSYVAYRDIYTEDTAAGA